MKQTKLTRRITEGATFLALSLPLSASAAGTKGGTSSGGTVQPPPISILPPNSADPQDVVYKAINYFLWIIGALAVIFLIWGAIQYITSGGSEDKVKSAKNTILYSLLGLVIAVTSLIIITWVYNTTGNLVK